MNKAVINRLMIFLLAGSLIMVSCQREYFQLDKLSDEIEIETDLVAPLIKGSLAMEDLVAWLDSTGYVDEFEDGLIYLYYEDTLVELMVDSLDLVVDGLYAEYYYGLDIGTDPIFIGSGVGDTVHFMKSKTFGIASEGNNRLDSVYFKGGRLVTEVSSTFLHTGFLTISSSQIRDTNGDPYSHTILISDASGSFTWTDSISLDRYSLEGIQQGDSSVFQMDYDLAVINSGNPVYPGDECAIRSSFLDMGFYSLFGFIDPGEVVRDSGVLDIPIYGDNPELTSLQLADPRINIYTENSLGIPFELELDSVIASSEDGTTETLVFYEGHPFVIPAPTIDQLGETAFGEFHINNQTSNFQDLLNIAPSTISYKVKGQVGSQNPSHFLLDTSRFMAKAEVLLPLDLKIADYALSDTMDFEVGEDGIDTALIKEVEVYLNTVNELPLQLGLQIYMLDENHLVLDSLFDENLPLLPASEVDQDGKLHQASDTDHTIYLPAKRLGALQHTKYLQIEAHLLTSGSGIPFVKFYSDYTLDFEISFYAGFRINTREL